MNQGGKGSKPRPFSVSQEEYDKRWDSIFRRDVKEESVDNKAKVTDNLTQVTEKEI